MVLIALQFYATGTFQTLKREYAEIARIPGIIGSIGGTHIRIQRPILHEKAYVNRKNYHSINMRAICDARHKYLSGFHVLHSEIRMSPTKVSWVIVACCVLHNLAIDFNMPLDDDWGVDVDDNADEEDMQGLHARPIGNPTNKDAELRRLGHIKRDGVAKQIFSR
ncbi:hypothetical protein DAPPUDRAFT_323650 [Daphnia pulex]|uniref:DDE Tnp4 domain-containing protein n=1 Tax=Daphnia pulex TaxID=6669 RepID=E9GZD5_DAPPU|nr:hypothetical protein DAPPUDRAFT_323650 [Daphnia pulex]|eukprot:EFX75180.1 hypothetical protein DAPPUDRAFT_323650 [Daphnia pulex]